MKKITAIFLFMIYAAASSGGTVHFHYCMDKLKGIGFTTEKKERCDNCGMNKGKNACCKDVHKTIQTQKDYQHATVNFVVPVVVAVIPTHSFYTEVAVLLQPAPPLQLSHGPPLTVPLFKQHCHYRV